METAGEVTVQLYAVREAPTLDAARVGRTSSSILTVRSIRRPSPASPTTGMRCQLTLLRAELGLDPPPVNTDHRKTNNQRKDIAAWLAGHRFGSLKKRLPAVG